MRYLTAVPAYGREYKKAADVHRDWLAGKDFRVVSGGSGYVSKSDLPEDAILQIRYKNATLITNVTPERET